MYAYNASKELEAKYLLALYMEGQEAEVFLLWTIWHCLLGLGIIWKQRNGNTGNDRGKLCTVLFIADAAGSLFWRNKNCSSPFVLTRNEINGPIFSQPNYLTFIKDGVGLNVLLCNYWMVIHPPVLFWALFYNHYPFWFLRRFTNKTFWL